MRLFLTRFLCRFAADRQGNVLLLTGLVFFVLVAAGGAGIDFGRQQLTRMKIQQAADAGALAAAILPDSATDEERRQTARRYYRLNYPYHYLGDERDAVNIRVEGDRVIVKSDKTLDTNFISSVGVNTLEAEGRSVVQKAATGVSDYDVMLVMDNSGSMFETDVMASNYTEPSNISAVSNQGLNTCLNDFGIPLVQAFCPGSYKFFEYPDVETCIAQYPTNPPWIRSQDPTIPPTRAPQLCSADPAFLGLAGNSRLNALRFAANKLVDTLFNLGTTKNRVGMVAWGYRIYNAIDLTDDADTIKAGIDGMYATDETNSTLGLLNAEQRLDAAIASDPGNNRVRAVVLLTDGINTNAKNDRVFNEDGTSKDSRGCNGKDLCPQANLDSRAVCERLKNKNVQVYTIAFGPEVTTGKDAAAAQAFLKGCASADTPSTKHFYPAATADELERIFTEITTQLQKLRIRR